jgi:hypothetical protein
MKRIIEYPLAGTDQTIYIEVDESDTGRLMPASRVDQAITKVHTTFEDAMDKVKPAASVIIEKIRSLHDAPYEVEVQFGIKLTADCGAVVASAGLEANYSVTLKWKNEEGPRRNPPRRRSHS